jgi:hypothetical protein
MRILRGEMEMNGKVSKSFNASTQTQTKGREALSPGNQYLKKNFFRVMAKFKTLYFLCNLRMGRNLLDTFARKLLSSAAADF